MIKVALAEDHELVRKGLSMLVDTFSGIDLIFVASNGREVLEKLHTAVPDILLLDLQMPELDGAACCKIVHEKYPDIKVLIVSHFSDADSIKKAIRSGANGFFSKNSPIEQLEAAIHDIDEHEFYFNSDLKEIVAEILNSNPDACGLHDEVVLSAREIEIVELICRQYTSAQTAEKLFINVRTVEAHRKRIMEKIGARNFVGVIFFALKNNIISINEV